MNKLWSLPLLAAALLGAACTTVQSISVSQIPEKSQRKNLITASGGSPVILSIPMGTDYVEETRRSLLSKCPHGAIEGLVSKDFTTNYFLGLVTKQSLLLRGYCVAEAKNETRGPNAGKGRKARRHPRS